MGIKLLFQNQISQKSKEYIEKVNELLLPESSKLLVFFDDSSEPESFSNSIFEVPAFFKNLELDGRIICCPNYIQREIDLFGAKHFIWISKRVCESNPVKLVLVYAHEMTHFRHNVFDLELFYLGCFLNRFFHFIKPNLEKFDNPTELDCERNAISTVMKIFSEAEHEQFFNDLNGDDKTYYECFRNFNLKSGSDPMKESIKI